MDSATTALQNGACTYWCISKQMHYCAAEAIFYCPTMNSHRPRSQNTAKEQALIPQKDSRRTCSSTFITGADTRDFRVHVDWRSPFFRVRSVVRVFSAHHFEVWGGRLPRFYSINPHHLIIATLSIPSPPLSRQ